LTHFRRHYEGKPFVTGKNASSEAFFSSRSEALEWEKTVGNPDELARGLGLDVKDVQNQEILRLEYDSVDFTWKPRSPSGREAGANDMFIRGAGETPNRVAEMVAEQVPVPPGTPPVAFDFTK
jgi:hypothetical protein